MNILAIIPARYGSTRLPGKPLIKLSGTTLIQRVYDRVKLCKAISQIVIATDDISIYNHVKKFGGQVVMTRVDHKSGTSRCAEVLEKFAGITHVINIQGDEPLIHAAQIEQLIKVLKKPNVDIGTLVKKIDQPADLDDPSKVKVVTGAGGKALYFSRSPIPFVRDEKKDFWLNHATFYKHIGMYGYKAEVLRSLSSLKQHPLELIEKLEQLNWLANGHVIHVGETHLESIGVDTTEDVKLVEKILSLA